MAKRTTKAAAILAVAGDARMLMSDSPVSEIKVGSVVEFQMRCPIRVTAIEDAYMGEPDPHPDLAAALGKPLAIIGEYMDGSGCRSLEIRRERGFVGGPLAIDY